MTEPEVEWMVLKSSTGMQHFGRRRAGKLRSVCGRWLDADHTTVLPLTGDLREQITCNPCKYTRAYRGWKAP